ncbi:hypothetical protein GLOTRDRAFT_131188 [Gloeophyllum trabeum ATCC 11539]|uniref:Uncharacterized protein n=1 Tax=Gloeophyllum trabeum (strain ATCC 11539 / FP-39264 / Madison 617) TaxID=670483 RepID=S7Q2W4_GLOTA|nr:uncharacterized protein GLOTRDRAFT_131188 [Gloeophyllum trabeum ATCC 11539]EPQ53858.1 hypothetical protein GLOTRDRAFT_131188 [Gloeophyllum trabeum ATCC 11539]
MPSPATSNLTRTQTPTVTLPPSGPTHQERAQNAPSSPVIVPGRVFGAADNDDDIFDCGPSRVTRQQRHHALYAELLELAPWIRDELRRRGPGGSVPIARALEDGRKAARADDISGVKRCIQDWHDFVPALPLKKNMRGFRHEECGRLLCPTIYDWTDPVVKEGLAKKDRKYDTGSRNWPVLLWRDEAVDETDLHIGFMKNELMVKAALHVFRGPSAATSEDTLSCGKRKGIAAIHGVTKISSGAIVYCAMLVHFALSSQNIFGAGNTTGGFAYRAFYQELVQYIDTQMPRDSYAELLAWWNSRLFPEAFDEDDDVENTSQGGISMAARMLAQRQVHVGLRVVEMGQQRKQGRHAVSNALDLVR